jgi:hypothetical protein
MADKPNGIDYTNDPRFTKKEQGDLVVNKPNGIDYTNDPRFVNKPNGIDYTNDPRFVNKPNGIDYTNDPRFTKKEQGDLVVNKPNGIDYTNTPSFRRLVSSGYLTKGTDEAPADNAVAFKRENGNIDIANVVIDKDSGIVQVILNPNIGDVVNVINYAEKDNAGSIFAHQATDAAFYEPGAACVNVNDATGSTVTVNGYTVTEDPDVVGTKKGLELLVTDNTNKYGSVPDSINIPNDMLGHQYDVIFYTEDATTNDKVIKKASTFITYIYQRNDSNPNNFYTGTRFQNLSTENHLAVGDLVGFNNVYTKPEEGQADTNVYPIGYFLAKVKAVNADGKVKAIEILKCDLQFNIEGVDASAFRDIGSNTSRASLYIANKDGVISTNEAPLKIFISKYDLCATEVIPAYDENKPVTPDNIIRYAVTGSTGSLIRPQLESDSIPENYYLGNFGVNPSSAAGGIKLAKGSTGFFDDPDISDIEFKWRYAELLVKAFRGEIDPRIMSPVRCPAKFLFDGAFNTIVGQSILPSVKYNPTDIVNSATMYTEEEREEVLYNPNLMSFVQTYDVTNDIDVKQAMYDLMVYRCYYGLPEDKRPIGPGFGLSVHFDSGVTDFTTAQMVNDSFKRRFDNPNASWDIGGYTSTNGVTYTYTKWIVDHLIEHCKNVSVNKPFVMSYATIPNSEYTSFYPDLDVTDWDLRELLYESGGNAWVPDINGNLVRRSQRTMFYANDTSDLLQESNMRTLSQLCYLLQNMIDGCLYSYTDDGVLQTMTDMCKNRFSAWPGNLVDTLDISFERDINPTDGGEIVVCYCNVSFRGLFLRVPIIVNVNRRAQ